MDEELPPQTIDQKKMSFAGNSDHIQAAITILKECGGVVKLVGESEYETIVNAVRLDTQQDLMTNFINALDEIKKGSLHQPR